MLEINDLSRRYGSVVALDGLTFSVEPGRLMGFVGPNGAGKTTAMRIVLGLLEPDRGTVHWNGAPITETVRHDFGCMPEERGLYPKMRVRNHLEYLALLSNVERTEAHRRAEYWMDKLGIAQRADDRVEALSLGNQQRVQLAGALINNPRALVLDEPFSGLDPVGVDVMSGVLNEQVERGTAVLFSSHQLDLVERLCDAVAIISKGRLVASGRVGELRSRREQKLVKVELQEASADWYASLPGARAVETRGNSVILSLTDGTDEQAVLDRARECGQVLSFDVVRPTLSELFREVVEA
jgi:ABC-2 type transport system ATP-binding protein